MCAIGLNEMRSNFIVILPMYSYSPWDASRCWWRLRRATDYRRVVRQPRSLMLAKIPSRDTQTVIKALIKQTKQLPEELYKSLTWDRGFELADHKRFTMATDIAVYFCDPQSPWQHGSNENTNRLLRQYFPKGTDLSAHSQARLNYIARELNERPRMTLGYQSPAERFQACVASTG